MAYTTGKSEWLGLLSLKEIFDSRLQPSAGSNPPIPAYGDKLRYHPYNHCRPSLAEETLLVEISRRNIKHLSLYQTNNYVLFRIREFHKNP
jgi:hypothetical protein